MSQRDLARRAARRAADVQRPRTRVSACRRARLRRLRANEQLMRLRQAVIAARELEPVVERLRSELGLGEPFSDPAVDYFGLRNAVFALGDTFLEVVTP